MPDTSARLKPCISTLTLYRPTGSCGARYTPDSFVVPRHTITPVSSFMTMSEAPGMTARDESLTVPEMVPVKTWPNKNMATHTLAISTSLWFGEGGGNIQRTPVLVQRFGDEQQKHWLIQPPSYRNND